MARFSLKSVGCLDTAHPDLQIVAHEAIKVYDFTVLQGRRFPAEQFEFFKKGRTLIGGKWVVTDKRKVVTNCDGYNKLSEHNEDPSNALDIAPYPIDWKNELEFFYLAGIFIALATKLRAEGVIQNQIIWGGRWIRLRDLPHYQIKKKS